MDATPEEWRPVVGYEGSYEVSSLGRVKSVARTITDSRGRRNPIRERILRMTPNRSGHLIGAFSVNGKMKTFAVHRIVMDAFIGPRPDGLEVCHNNGISTDNRLSNLRYDTRESNMADLVKHGNHAQARKIQCSKGHDLIPENVWIDKHGKRLCKQCSAFYLKRWKDRKMNRNEA